MPDLAEGPWGSVLVGCTHREVTSPRPCCSFPFVFGGAVPLCLGQSTDIDPESQVSRVGLSPCPSETSQF
eukprot:scaffold47198_cov17-Tisochrysis_lutea.AAC.1